MPSHHSRMRQAHGNQLGAPHQHKPGRVLGSQSNRIQPKTKSTGRNLGGEGKRRPPRSLADMDVSITVVDD